MSSRQSCVASSTFCRDAQPDTSEEEASEKSAAKTKRKKRGTVEDETISTGRGDAEEPESEPTEPRKRKQKKRLTEAVGKIGEQPVELVSETASPQGAKDEAAARCDQTL